MATAFFRIGGELIGSGDIRSLSFTSAARVCSEINWYCDRDLRKDRYRLIVDDVKRMELAILGRSTLGTCVLGPSVLPGAARRIRMRGVGLNPHRDAYSKEGR